MAVKIIPSVLTANFAALGEDVVALERAGVDRIHWDAMDGHFVPNLTFGPDLIASCRPLVSVGFEAHVMCDRPEELLPRYVEAGCELLILHPETLRQPHATFQMLRDMGARGGLALSPGTPLSAAEHLLDLIDLLLVMTVNPGFGGQRYIATMEPKVTAARALIDASGYDIELEVDGGVAPETIAAPAGLGATTFISGSALWRYPSFGEGVADLRERAEKARAER